MQTAIPWDLLSECAGLRKRNFLSFIMVMALLCMGPAFANDLSLLDSFSSTFPDTTTVWRVRVTGPAPTELTWELMLGQAVADRGQRLLDPAADGQPVALPVRIPPLREGVAMQAVLSVRAVGGGQSARLEHPVWILPTDAWEGLRGILSRTPVWACDLDGGLSARLREAGVFVAGIRNPAAIAVLTNGLVLVSEGVSLRAQRGLADALIRAAAGGARVIWLAPSDGTVPLPGHEMLSGLPRPAVRMEGLTALQKLDKRLDVFAWPGRPTAAMSSFAISADRRQPEAMWSADAQGWAWLDLDYRAVSGGRMLVVGWAPRRDWEISPAPRHILAALVRHVLE